MLTSKIFDTGYHILEDGKIIYTAFNHPQDSQVELPINHPLAVSKEKLQQYANITLDQWETE